MATCVLHHYGRFCATYALEVIVCFVTMVVAALTLKITSPYDLCPWAIKCNEPGEITSGAVLLTILRCGTIVYSYVQLKKIWKTGVVFGRRGITLDFYYKHFPHPE